MYARKCVYLDTSLDMFFLYMIKIIKALWLDDVQDVRVCDLRDIDCIGTVSERGTYVFV